MVRILRIILYSALALALVIAALLIHSKTYNFNAFVYNSTFVLLLPAPLIPLAAEIGAIVRGRSPSARPVICPFCDQQHLEGTYCAHCNAALPDQRDRSVPCGIIGILIAAAHAAIGGLIAVLAFVTLVVGGFFMIFGAGDVFASYVFWFCAATALELAVVVFAVLASVRALSGKHNRPTFAFWGITAGSWMLLGILQTFIWDIPREWRPQLLLLFILSAAFGAYGGLRFRTLRSAKKNPKSGV